jgi:hypothetical protein
MFSWWAQMSKKYYLTYFWILILSIFASQAFSESLYAPGWNASAELLYWRGHAHGLAYTNKPSEVLFTDDFTLKPVTRPDFEWELGYRLGAGYTTCNCAWTFEGYYTYLTSRARGKKSFNSGAPEFLGIFPIWSLSADTLASDYVSAAASHWHLRLNMLDLNAQYNFPCLCERLALIPFLGVRGVSLDQKLQAEYAGGTFFNGTDQNSLKNYYLGAGPRFGLNADFFLNSDFGIFGHIAIAPLFGHLHIKQRETYLENLRFHRSRGTQHYVLSTDFSLGLRWQNRLCADWPIVDLRVAWEGQEFWHVNRFRPRTCSFFARKRSLFLQGVTCSAAVNF